LKPERIVLETVWGNCAYPYSSSFLEWTASRPPHSEIGESMK